MTDAIEITLTEREIRIIKCVVHDNWQEAIEIAREEFGWLTRTATGWTENKERKACETVLDALDLTIPWAD